MCTSFCGMKSLRMFIVPVRYIWWQPWDSSLQSSSKTYCYSLQQDLEDRIGNQERRHWKNLHHFRTILFADIWCIISFLSVYI